MHWDFDGYGLDHMCERFGNDFFLIKLSKTLELWLGTFNNFQFIEFKIDDTCWLEPFFNLLFTLGGVQAKSPAFVPFSHVVSQKI